MSYSIEKLPNMSVVIETLHSGFRAGKLAASAMDAARVLDAQNERVYWSLSPQKEVYSMTYRIERLPGEPIIVVTWSQQADVPKEAPGQFAEVDALIGPDEKVFIINDLSDLQMDFGSMTTGMAAQVLPKVPGAPSDPRIHTILIGSGFLWDIAVKAAKQLQYGGLDVPLVPSLEAALAYARERIKTW